MVLAGPLHFPRGVCSVARARPRDPIFLRLVPLCVSYWSSWGKCLIIHPHDFRTTSGNWDSCPHFISGKTEAYSGLGTPPGAPMEFLLRVSNCFL